MERKAMHYWRIHARVTRRVWTDCSPTLQFIIANDAAHVTEEYKWFAAKVDADTQRLFEDPNHWDNAPETFQYSNVELFVPLAQAA